MNKSKFLKKSLAMLLAVMLVVAMIPLGASAAEVPAVTKVMIGTETATLSGSTYSATISQTSSTTDAKITIILDKGAGVVYSNDGTVDSLNDQYVITPSATAFAAKKVTFTVWDTTVANYKEYTATWTYAAQSSDNSIVSIGLTTSTDQYGSTVEVDGVLTITTSYDVDDTKVPAITVKVNEKASVSATGATATTTVNGVSSITSYQLGKAFTVKVTAENGSARSYTVKVVEPEYFPSFSVTGERKDATFDETSDTYTVYVPYDQATVTGSDKKTYYELETNFTTGYPSASVTTTNSVYPAGSSKAFTSGGKLYVENTSGGEATLTYSYASANATKTFKVQVSHQTYDPKAEITALKLGNYYGTISGDTITVELPATYMANATITADLQIKGSDGATAKIVGTTSATGTNAVNSSTFVSLASAFAKNVESENIIRVTSGQKDDDDNTAVNDYKLVVKKVGISETATLNAFILEDGDGNQYKATIGSNSVTVALPYSSTTDTVKTWKLYYASSNGSEVSLSDSSVINASGETLSQGAQGLIPAGNAFDGATAGATKLVVTASDNSKKTYSVYATRLAASTGKSITSFGVTKETSYASLTDSNVYYGSIGSSSITVQVPYSAYNNNQFSGANIVPVFEVSDGATVYYISDTTNLTATKLVGVADGTTGEAIKVNGNTFDGTTDNSGATKTLKLVVASEGATDLSASGTSFDGSWKSANYGKWNEYTLIVKQKTANTTWNIAGVELFDTVTNEHVYGTVSGTTISFTNIPNHFLTDSNASGKGVYFSYTVSNGEYVATPATNGSAASPITYDDDGSRSSGGVEVTFTQANDGTVTASVNDLYIESEDGNAGKATPHSWATMSLTYGFAEAETGCDMTSMTINNVTARPDSDNQITFTLPYGTEVTALKPTWVVSKYATVTVGGAQVNSGDVALNFTGSHTFLVTSEDGLNTKTYTVTVTTDEQFSDVKTTDWFYQDVMEAAANGIVYGIGNGLFNPYGSVTRGQFAQFMARVDGYNVDDYIEKTPFSDVKAGTEQSAAIAYCAEQGYIVGKGDTTFAPNETITREQMAIIIAKALNLDVVTDPASTFADDADISSWAKGYVYACSTAGVLSGTGNNKYSPKSVTSRAEAAAVAMRVSRLK